MICEINKFHVICDNKIKLQNFYKPQQCHHFVPTIYVFGYLLMLTGIRDLNSIPLVILTRPDRHH